MTRIFGFVFSMCSRNERFSRGYAIVLLPENEKKNVTM